VRNLDHQFLKGEAPANKAEITSPWARPDLRQRREALRLSVDDLAAELDVDRAQIARLERGVGPDGEPRAPRPGSTCAARISAALRRREDAVLEYAQQFASLAEVPGSPAFELAAGMIEEGVLDRIDAAFADGRLVEQQGTGDVAALVCWGGLTALLQIVAPRQAAAMREPVEPLPAERAARVEALAARYRDGYQLFGQQDQVPA